MEERSVKLYGSKVYGIEVSKYGNEKLDIYIWAVTHFGTSWDYVLTDIKLI